MSASKVSGIMKVGVKIREGYPEVRDNLKKIIVIVDGKKYEFDKPPYVIEFDTSRVRHRLIKISAQAIGKGDESDEDILSSYYIYQCTSPLDASKPFLLFGRVIEPPLDTIDRPWTPEMYQK